MDTNMTGFRWFSKILRSCALDDSIVSALEGLMSKFYPQICHDLDENFSNP